ARQTGLIAYEEWQYEINLRDIATDPASHAEPRAIAPTADRWNINPQISPDGNRVIFQSTRSGRYEIWVSDRDGGHARPVTTIGEYTSAPRWAPDSRHIAFLASDGESVGEETLIRAKAIHALDVDSGANRIVFSPLSLRTAVTGW